MHRLEEGISRRFSLTSFWIVCIGVSVILLSLVLVQYPIVVPVLLFGGLALIVSVGRPDLFVYMLLALIPITYARPIGGFPVALEQSKILAIPLILLHCLGGNRAVPKIRVRSVYFWPVAGILAGAFISSFRVEEPPIFFRDLGRLLMGISCLWAVLNICTTWQRVRIALWCLIGGALLLCLVVFIQIATQSYTPIYYWMRGDFYTPFSPTREILTPWDGRGYGLSHPNETSGYIGALFPIALSSLLYSKRRIWHYGLLAIMLIGIFLAFSRSVHELLNCDGAPGDKKQ